MSDFSGTTFSDNSVEPLVSLHFITAELRRRRHILVIAALIGVLGGIGYHQLVPRKYEAAALVVLAHNPNEDPLGAMNTDTDLATTRAVAQGALKTLHSPMSINGFLGVYQATQVTTSLLKITATGSSYDQAVARDQAVTNSFLTFRADQLTAQNDALQSSLQSQINSAQTKIQQLTTQINNPHGSNSTALSDLVSQQSQDQSQVNSLQGTLQSNALAVTAQIKGSQVVDAASPVLKSSLKITVINMATGLIAGGGIGLLLVVLLGLLSTKLRTRSDVALALDAPIELSQPHRIRLRARRSKTAAAVADHLAVGLTSGATPAPIAIVSIDSDKVAAPAILKLGEHLAGAGKRVLIADLTPDGTLARTAHATPAKPSVVDGANGGRLTVAHPPHLDRASGPLALRRNPDAAQPAWFEGWATSDVLITFAAVDPASGAEHLRTWATQAIAIVTAGRSTGTKISSVANMLRLANVPLAYGVLLEADPKDESLGVATTSQALRYRERQSRMAGI